MRKVTMMAATAMIVMLMCVGCTHGGGVDVERLRALQTRTNARVEQAERVIDQTREKLDAVTVELDTAIQAARDAGNEAEALRIERARAETTERLSSVIQTADTYLEQVRPFQDRIAAELDAAGDVMTWDEGVGAAFRVAEPALPADWKVYGSLAVGLLGIIGTAFENKRRRDAQSDASNNVVRAEAAWDEAGTSRAAFENLVAAIEGAKQDDGTVRIDRVAAASLPETRRRVREIRKAGS